MQITSYEGKTEKKIKRQVKVQVKVQVKEGSMPFHAIYVLQQQFKGELEQLQKQQILVPLGVKGSSE